jgi:hypothetical protein
MAGLVPAIPLRRALNPDNRDARVKPGNDASEGGRFKDINALPIQSKREPPL